MNHASPQLALLVIALLSGAASAAQTAPERYPLNRDALANALTAAGAPVTAADLTLPSALTSATPSPEFTVGSAGLAGPAQLRIRVACSRPGQCLPFMVVADLHNHGAALAAQQQLTPHNAAAASGQHASADLLRAGQHATLLLEDDRMRISLPVISIDTGAPGTQIRVASLDRKQTYRGIVTDPGTVRGVLP